MRRTAILTGLIALLCMGGLLSVGGKAVAQTNTKANKNGIYVIFDASNSMWGELPSKARKIEVAKNVLSEFAQGDFSDRDVALRIYGHNRAGDCSDTELVTPFGTAAQNLGPMQSAVQSVTPRGKTPISKSLEAALVDFGSRTGDILLISDGIETCGVDPCALMEQWRQKNVSIKVHVVGFGLDDIAREAMSCIAETSGGRYFDADSADQLADALSEARTTAVAGKPIPPAAAKPKQQATGPELEVFATDATGYRHLRVDGTITRDDGTLLEIKPVGHPKIEPGTYKVTVGVKLIDGTIYKPTSQYRVMFPV